MKKRLVSVGLAAAMLLGSVPTALAAGGQTFTDRNGQKFTVPENGWATRVVSFEHGNPWTIFTEFHDTKRILGPSDWNGKELTESQGDLNLGAGGVIVLEYNVDIVDGPGDDIYVFEVGPDVESTQVEVSKDLKTWYVAGTAKGKTAGVDLNGKVPEGSRFRYVRLTDLREYPNSDWPGADIDAVAGLNVKPITSDWAKDEVDKAEDYELIPDMLENQDMTKSITRLEFAAVSVKTYEKLTGTKALPAITNPFTDCDDSEMRKAYNLGITTGTSATTFSPNTLLTREQAATMLTRVFKRATMPKWSIDTDSNFPLTFTQPAKFADDANISSWAKNSVYFMAANNIITGVGGNKFAPNNTTSVEQARGYANATREQALAIAVRMVDNLD